MRIHGFKNIRKLSYNSLFIFATSFSSILEYFTTPFIMSKVIVIVDTNPRFWVSTHSNLSNKGAITREIVIGSIELFNSALRLQGDFPIPRNTDNVWQGIAQSLMILNSWKEPGRILVVRKAEDPATE